MHCLACPCTSSRSWRPPAVSPPPRCTSYRARFVLHCLLAPCTSSSVLRAREGTCSPQVYQIAPGVPCALGGLQRAPCLQQQPRSPGSRSRLELHLSAEQAHGLLGAMRTSCTPLGSSLTGCVHAGRRRRGRHARRHGRHARWRHARHGRRNWLIRCVRATSACSVCWPSAA